MGLPDAMNLHALVKDLRAAGIPYDPEDRLPPPVRHRAALYVALGHLVERVEAVHTSAEIPLSQLRVFWILRRRTSAALDWIRAVGRRSRWASWFEREF